METWRQRLVLLAILLLATGLRFYRLDAQSFWNDEGNSARLSERAIPAIIEGTASDIHPPLYYLILRGWRELVGDSEFGLRSFSAFVGVGTVALTFALGKEVGTRINADDADKKKNLRATFGGPSTFVRVPLLAGLLTAVSPPLIYYSQEARMYALLAFWAVLSTWLFLRWQSCVMRHASYVMRHASCVKWMIGYLVVAVAGLYTHYFFAAVLLTHNFLILIWLLRKRRPLTRSPVHPLTQWTAIMLAAFLAYLPWLPIFLNQTGGRPGGRGEIFHFLADAGRWLAFGATIEPETAVLPLSAAVLLMVNGLMIKRRETAVLPLLIPVLFMFAAGTTKPEFFKFMVVAVPFLYLIVAMGWERSKINDLRLNRGRFQSLVFNLLIIVFLFGNGRSLQNLYFNPAYARADYRSIAARIEADDQPHAGVILNAANQWEVFTYYHRDGAPVYPIPKGQPQPDKIAADLAAIAARHDRLYAIFWGEAQRDPERLVERWLDEHAFKAADEWVGDVRFVTYAVPAEPAVEMETAVNLPFGDAITLNGYTLASDNLAPGDIVQVTLFWETAVPLPTRYKVFLHLINENGELVAQRDSEPGGGLNLTTRWPPGEIISDNHGLLIPTNTPPGSYQLRLGLYDLADPNARLPIQTKDGLIDAYPIATISVE